MSEAGRPDPGRSFLGGLLLVGGALMMTLCGLCTLFFAGASIVDILRTHGHQGESYSPSILQAAVIIGAPPTLMGAGLVWLGIRLRRPRPPRASPPPR